MEKKTEYLGGKKYFIQKDSEKNHFHHLPHCGYCIIKIHISYGYDLGSQLLSKNQCGNLKAIKENNRSLGIFKFGLMYFRVCGLSGLNEVS